MAKLLWEPGKAPYATWLASLTPEEKAQHLADRKIKKSMKKAFEQVVLAQQEEWLARINDAFISVLRRAEQSGDPAALVAVFDRLVGKPDSAIDVTSNGQTLQAPTVVFQSSIADEWKTDDHKTE